jgi:hypothetical protein
MNKLIKQLLLVVWTPVVYVDTFVKVLKARGFGKHDDSKLIEEANVICKENRLPEGFQPDGIIKLGDEEFGITFNPYVHIATNTVGCKASIACGMNQIFVDNAFRNMSWDGQQFIIAHEIGHYKCGHMVPADYNRLRVQAAREGKVCIPEVEADLYAAQCIGVTATLTGLADLRQHTHGIPRKEIEYRIETLKANTIALEIKEEENE